MSMWEKELELATRFAREAGEVTLRWYQAGPAVERKADGSPVTVADREAERLLRDRIADAFPDDGVYGEEWGETLGTSGRRWILDPIDGTNSFIHGVPLYGVMVALEVHGDAVLGVLRFPALDDTVAAARGTGCTWNGTPARVSDVDRLDRALVLSSDAPLPRAGAPVGTGKGTGGKDEGGEKPAKDRTPATVGPPSPGPPLPPAEARLARRLNGLARLASRAGTVRTWGDCYGYALVATGRAEAMLDPVLHAWDAAAVLPIIEEAGGAFTDWAGKVTHLSGHAVATNAALAAEVRRVLTEEPTP